MSLRLSLPQQHVYSEVLCWNPEVAWSGKKTKQNKKSPQVVLNVAAPGNSL